MKESTKNIAKILLLLAVLAMTAGFMKSCYDTESVRQHPFSRPTSSSKALH